MKVITNNTNKQKYNEQKILILLVFILVLSLQLGDETVREILRGYGIRPFHMILLNAFEVGKNDESGLI